MPYVKLTKRDNDNIWSSVRKLIDIQLFYFERGKPESLGPKSSMIYSIKDHIEVRDIEQLKAIFAKAFKYVVDEGEMMYALDWQHDSYQFSPHDDWSDLPINIFTEGDYFIFLNEQLTEGTFGHPWQNSICFFGAKLCEFIDKNKPVLCNGVIRKNI